MLAVFSVFTIHVESAKWKLLSMNDEGDRSYYKMAHAFSDTALYTFGGESEGCYNGDLKKFDPGKRQWTVLPPAGAVPASRAGATLTKIGSSLYLIGGHNNNGTMGTIHQYDIITNKWSHVYIQENCKFMSRSGHASCTDGQNRIFVFGGYNDDGIFLNDLYEITITTKSSPEPYETEISASFKLLSADSTKRGLNPSPKEFASLQHIDSMLYLYGGYSYGGSSHDGMWTYDLQQLKWSAVDCAILPPPSEGLSSVTMGRSILYFGGCDFGYGSNRCYNDIWRFDTTSSKWYIIPTADNKPKGRAFAAIAFIGDTLIVHGGSKLDKIAFGETYQLLDLLPCKDPAHTCLGRGTCSGVSCICNQGYTGHDCGITVVNHDLSTNIAPHTEM
ncbi:kelch repeat domain containing protein protein, putative [Babesia ovis]|uniref:Kelch repeat domain containing protein protein, putative n=1 Tax=Babesia ovis TaxID=5869 RepID=A0A9W5T9W8_BABOV|nr:kelch repeat domain containing protein protein, putative [Babesia ovis]